MDCKIVKHLGNLSTTKSGWALEFNLVEWTPDKSGPFQRYDIRHWAPDHSKAGKGISMSDEEIAQLKEMLEKI